MDSHKTKILNFFNEYRRLPGYKELMQLTGFKSKNAVYKLINKLVEEGVVIKDSQGKITPSRSLDGLPLLGLVEAGFPSPASQDLTETISLDDYLVRNKNNSFVLEVKGDSMIDAGIQEGDLVIVEKGKKPEVGDIVIAQVDGEHTMKYYRKGGGKTYLEPANNKYKPIYPTHDLKIDAVVKGVIRRY